MLDSFFPRASAHAEPRVADGAFIDDARAVHIGADGVMTRHARVASSSIAPRVESDRVVAVASLLVVLGLALPLVAARAAKHVRLEAVAWASAMCVLCIFLMQAAAARRASPLLVLVPATALLIHAAVRYREPAW